MHLLNSINKNNKNKVTNKLYQNHTQIRNICAILCDAFLWVPPVRRCGWHFFHISSSPSCSLSFRSRYELVSKESCCPTVNVWSLVRYHVHSHSSHTFVKSSAACKSSVNFVTTQKSFKFTQQCCYQPIWHWPFVSKSPGFVASCSTTIKTFCASVFTADIALHYRIIFQKPLSKAPTVKSFANS